MKYRIILLLLPCLSLFSLCGCWDRIEIEDMLIIAGVAIDCSSNGKSLIATYQHVIPEGVGGGERAAPARKYPYANISVEGTSITKMSEKINNIKSRRLNYEHLMVIIISDEVARNFDLRSLLNGILRYPETPRNAVILISEGKARLFFEVEPNIEDIPASNIMKMTQNTRYKSGMPFVVKLGDLSEKMAGGKSFAVQKIAMRDGIKSSLDAAAAETGHEKGDVYEIRGAAVIKGNPCILAGWLDEKETNGLNFIQGKVESDAIETRHENTGETVVFRMRSINTKVKPYISGGDVSFTIESEIEGSITEDWATDSNAFENGYIEKLETAVKKEVENIIKEATYKMHKELKADVMDFGKKFHIKYPSVWEKIKDNWEDILQDASIDIKVKIYIREFERKGMAK